MEVIAESVDSIHIEYICPYCKKNIVMVLAEIYPIVWNIEDFL
eukprot:COSAG01_NODE_54710_length_330_cov_0.809524_1_plen_42_part_10